MKKTGLKIAAMIIVALVLGVSATALHQAEAGQQIKAATMSSGKEPTYPVIVTGAEAEIPQALLAELKSANQ